MNHLIRIFLALGLSIAAVLIILSSTDQFGLHARMDVFVAETIRTAAGKDVVIEEYVEATMPRRLQKDMTRGWFRGSFPHLQVRPLFPVEFISSTELITYPVQTYAYMGYSRWLPYPPEDVWCVRVKSSDPTVPKVLLIVFHKDIYTASWVVHEPIDPEVTLAAVGCKFASQ
jgi:hypothetical protein